MVERDEARVKDAEAMVDLLTRVPTDQCGRVRMALSCFMDGVRTGFELGSGITAQQVPPVWTAGQREEKA